MDDNKNQQNIENVSNQINKNSEHNKSLTSNWMDKLKPSLKNKLIAQKYKNLSSLETVSAKIDQHSPYSDIQINSQKYFSNKLNQIPNKTYNSENISNLSLTNENNNLNKNNNFDDMNLINSLYNSPVKTTPNKNKTPIEKEFLKIFNEQSQNKNLLSLSINLSRESIEDDENNKSYLAKWNKCVFENRPHVMELNNIQNQSHVIQKNHIDNTVLSDDIEKINNIMEERIKLNLCENGFLKQPYHSIIPFILMQNKEIHRMCLSDYELKLFYKTYNKKKSECERKNPYESYRQGIIKFYKGKYLDSYFHFKSAHVKKDTDLNIAKWLAFTSIILLMCNKKIDFTNIKNVKVDFNKEEENTNENNIVFPCCSSRKNDGRLKSLAMNSIQNNFHFNNININNTNNYFENNSYNIKENCNSFNASKISQINLAKEITKLLKLILKKENNQNLNSVCDVKNLNLDDSCVKEVKSASHEIEAW